MYRILLPFLLFPFFLSAQFGDFKDKPIGWDKSTSFIAIPNQDVKADNEEIERLKKIEHSSYISATAIPSQISFQDFTLSEILPNGDKVYRLLVSSSNALGLMLNFENFKLEEGAKLWLYDIDRQNFIGSYSKRDNYTDTKSFMTSVVRGNTIVVEYLEPKNLSTLNFQITKVYHFFRGLKSTNGTGFGTAGSCMVNAACSEGTGYESVNAATCRILVTGSNFSGWCSGTLLNNTAEDGTPYVMTANHCSANSTLSDLVNWEFHFLYQSSGCSNPTTEPISLNFKGSSAAAYTGSDNGDNSSDFLLLKINGSLPSNLYDFTYLGWDRTGVTTSNNLCFSHPRGDVKKVSRTSGLSSIASYGGNVSSTHFQVFWASTTHGYSVTEEGSSGSNLVNSAGLFIGTLTGGGSSCSSPNNPDFYGRLFMHWDKYGSATNQRASYWLDPLNTGATSLRTIKSSGAVISPSKISNQDASNSLEVFRTADALNLTWNSTKYTINIYNSIGQKLTSQISNSQTSTIDIQNLSSGTYIIEVENETQRATKKIIW